MDKEAFEVAVKECLKEELLLEGKATDQLVALIANAAEKSPNIDMENMTKEDAGSVAIHALYHTPLYTHLMWNKIDPEEVKTFGHIIDELVDHHARDTLPSKEASMSADKDAGQAVSPADLQPDATLDPFLSYGSKTMEVVASAAEKLAHTVGVEPDLLGGAIVAHIQQTPKLAERLNNNVIEGQEFLLSALGENHATGLSDGKALDPDKALNVVNEIGKKVAESVEKQMDASDKVAKELEAKKAQEAEKAPKKSTVEKIEKGVDHAKHDLEKAVQKIGKVLKKSGAKHQKEQEHADEGKVGASPAQTPEGPKPQGQGKSVRFK